MVGTNSEKDSRTAEAPDPHAVEGAEAAACPSSPQHGVVLFYKYHPLSTDRILVEQFRAALRTLCTTLQLTGRILLGYSPQYQSEGWNGTVAGTRTNVQQFMTAFTTTTTTVTTVPTDTIAEAAVLEFRRACDDFCHLAGCAAEHPIRMDASDFKWSTLTTDETTQQIFPDMQIKIVHELISTGGKLAPIPLSELQQGYLTPQEWQAKLQQLEDTEKNQNNETQNHDGSTHKDNKNNSCDNEDTLVIDCRNTKEYAIGHFKQAINPKTTTFNQFPQWVDEHQHLLQNKKTILMYCTGGIRCEKASAYIRRTLHQKNKNTNKETGSAEDEARLPQVYHLQGGIHKYLERYGSGTSSNGTTGQPKNGSSSHNSTIGRGSNSPKEIDDDGNNTNNNDSSKTSKNNDGNTSQAPSFWRGKNFVFDGRGRSDHGGCGKKIMLTSSTTGSNNSVEVNTTTPNTIAAASFPDPMTGHDSTNNATPTNTDSAATVDNDIVGACRYCTAPYDTFDPHCVCTVCREPILVCTACQHNPRYREYHCQAHQQLQTCYFTTLAGYTPHELHQQLSELETQFQAIAVGRKYKQKRRTLLKQCAKIQQYLEEFVEPQRSTSSTTVMAATTTKAPPPKCRNCQEYDCSGHCWGFHSLKRKRILEKGQHKQSLESTTAYNLTRKPKQKTTNSARKQRKVQQQQLEVAELVRLQLIGTGPEKGRNPITGLRVPRPCIRILQTTTKGKWCGVSLLKVLQTEFFSRPRHPTDRRRRDSGGNNTNANGNNALIHTLLRRGLIRVNGKPIGTKQVEKDDYPNTSQSSSYSVLDDANQYKLKNMDIIDRIVLWHEPPVYLPQPRIDVQKIMIPKQLLVSLSTFGDEKKKQKQQPNTIHTMKNGNDDENGTSQDDDDSADASPYYLYVCNKPTTVPVHPAGPYLSNTLTMMVEGQLQLPPKSLIPCHRIDRVTSGITICCTSPIVARFIQSAMSNNTAATNNSNTNSNCNKRSRSYVRKQYLAKVLGKFPGSSEYDDRGKKMNGNASFPKCNDYSRWMWISNNEDEEVAKTLNTSTSATVCSTINCRSSLLQIDGPIETIDPANGVRRITSNGKAATSRFRLIEYDQKTDTSIILCQPITGRSHQLRVHLGWLGYPIVGDKQYSNYNHNSDFGNDDTYNAITSAGHNRNTLIAPLTALQNQNGPESIHPRAGINRILESIQKESTTTTNDADAHANSPACSNGITREQEQAAREVCPTCKDAATVIAGRENELEEETSLFSSSFSPAQLLQGGHSICLHAFRYKFVFSSVEKESKERSSACNANVATSAIGSRQLTATATVISIPNSPEEQKQKGQHEINVEIALPLWASHLTSTRMK